MAVAPDLDYYFCMDTKREPRVALFLSEKYVYKIGTPFLLITGREEMRNGVVGIGEGFLFIIDKMGLSERLEDMLEVTIPPLPDDLLVDQRNQDAVIEGLRQAKSFGIAPVRRMQADVFERERNEVAVKPFRLRRVPDWKRFLHVWWVRGLPEDAVRKVEQNTGIPDLQRYLRWLTEQRRGSFRTLK